MTDPMLITSLVERLLHFHAAGSDLLTAMDYVLRLDRSGASHDIESGSVRDLRMGLSQSHVLMSCVKSQTFHHSLPPNVLDYCSNVDF